MAEYQPLSVPSNYYDHSTGNAATPAPVPSLNLMDHKDTRKRKQRVSANEAYFTNYQWQEADHSSPATSSIQQHKQWPPTMEHENTHSAAILSSHSSFDNSAQQQNNPPPFAFDDFQQDPHPFFDGNYKFDHHQQPYSQEQGQTQQTQQTQQQYQQLYSHQIGPDQKSHDQQQDPLQSLLQSQNLDQRTFHANASPFSDTQMHLASWDSTLPTNQSPTTYRPNSHASNHTTFPHDGFLESLSDQKHGNKLEFDIMKFDTIPDSSLDSGKSTHPLPSPVGNSQNNNSGNMMLLTSQHHPTGTTPPSSPATMNSSHSSPAITPMYGRLSTLSLRQHQQHPTPATPMNNVYQHHGPPLASPTGMAFTAKNGGNGGGDVDMMMTINEGPPYDSYAPLQHPTTATTDLMMDYQAQCSAAPLSGSSPSTTTSTVHSNNNTGSSTNNGINSLQVLPPRNRHAVATARVIQQQATAAKIRPIIQQYLRSKDPIAMGEKTVIIMSSKVAQKSYGTEKRFLCPPPTAILVGSTWWSKKNRHPPTFLQNNTTLMDGVGEDGDDEQQQNSFQEGHGDTMTIVTPPKVTVCISGESSSQVGQIEWYSQANATVVGQTGFPRQQTQSLQTSTAMANSTSTTDHGTGTSSNTSTRFKSHSSTETKNNGGDWYHNPRMDLLGGGRCVSKQLYINDADEKRKRVECLVKLQVQGHWMGTLAGKGIKVISKPSKKRQSVKNLELCIHHGSVVSLFNRIRSQTVSTKYLGVSNGNDSAFAYPGQLPTEQTKSNDGTCFVARTASWDPFVIWLVDTSRPPEQQKFRDDNNSASNHPEDYIGHRAFKPSVNYPPPPAIALRNTTQQPLAIHYNQHIVLQCLTTGLVSPVMIIRKVDKASTVVGGARCVDEPLLANGGEYGDEVLGDPTSQLHKVALQIVHDPSQATAQQQQAYHRNVGNDLVTGLMESMLPRYSSPVTYLACLNDMVGMHRSTEQRQPILKTPPPPPPHQPQAFAAEEIVEEGGRVVRKRKVSTYVNQTSPPSPASSINSNNPMVAPEANGVNDMFYNNMQNNTGSHRRRVNSYDDYGIQQQRQQHQHLQASSSTSTLAGGAGANGSWINHRSRSVSIPDTHHRRVSTSSATSSSSSSTSWINGPLGGAYWYEDVSDAAVWTLVGVDIGSYTFLPPPLPGTSTAEGLEMDNNHGSNDQFRQCNAPSQQQHRGGPSSSSPASLVFPHLSHYSVIQDDVLQLHGENLARDLQVWLGDIKALHVEYKSRELVICRLPPRQELLECPFIESYQTIGSKPTILSSSSAANSSASSPTLSSSTSSPTPSLPRTGSKTHYQLPFLLVKTGDGIIHKSNFFYQF